MPKSPTEPTNLVLEQLRLMRAETSAGFTQVRAEIKELRGDVTDLRGEISDIKKEIRGLKLSTIAEIYKANLTVASFADHERRIQALEMKSS
jgi:uncharacterized coiled-coil DUF342 family protein